MKRFFFTLLLIVMVIYAPWWAVLGVASFGAFVFPWYLEVIFAGIFFDILYGAVLVSFFGFGVLGFLSAVVLFLGMEKIKQNLR